MWPLRQKKKNWDSFSTVSMHRMLTKYLLLSNIYQISDEYLIWYICLSQTSWTHVPEKNFWSSFSSFLSLSSLPSPSSPFLFYTEVPGRCLRNHWFPGFQLWIWNFYYRVKDQKNISFSVSIPFSFLEYRGSVLALFFGL